MFFGSILVFALVLCCYGCEVQRLNSTSETAADFKREFQLEFDFLTEDDGYEIISPITEFEPGIRQNIIRYLGIPKGERDTYRFDICRPKECPLGKGYITVCYYTNRVENPARSVKNETMKDPFSNKHELRDFDGSQALREKCPPNFAAIKIIYESYRDHFYLGKYPLPPGADGGSLPNDKYDDNDDFHINRKNVNCVTAHFETNAFYSTRDVRSKFRPHFRPANPKKQRYNMDCLSWWDYAPFHSELHKFQSAIILSETSNQCVPRLYLHLPEYVKRAKKQPPSTPEPTTPEPTTTTEASTAATTEPFVAIAIPQIDPAKQYWWHFLIAGIALLSLSAMFLVASIILSLKGEKKVNKLFVKVLLKRREFKGQ